MTRSGAEQAARYAVPGCAGLAALTVAVLPLAVPGVDPVAEPISDHATRPVGFVLVAVAAGAAAVAGLLLAAALARGGPPGTRIPRILLRLWCAALFVAAAVPTNPPGTDPDLGAHVHRGAAACLLVLLPLAGWLLARQARATDRWAPVAPRLHAWSAAAGAFALAFLAAHLPVLSGGAPYPLLGLLERLFVLCGAGLLLALARVPTAAVAVPGRPTQALPAPGAAR
ncbi:DUF998 domain-containing protein [Pseudonocardia sp.]|uniref:DUF998 domain-containing protein n=1 Tax=Pseudonocardia sp. TaxID=60912 RepID=UPI003D145232